MIVTYIGMASIFLGFLCVMAAFWLFHNREDRRGPIVLGLLAILFLTSFRRLRLCFSPQRPLVRFLFAGHLRYCSGVA